MRVLIYGAVVLTAGAAFLVWEKLSAPTASDKLFQPASRRIELAPICPWREPGADMQAFFGEGAAYTTQIRILSGKRLELQDKLGRAPTGDENSLSLYQVSRHQQPLGTILTRRVKGEDGAIELVLAVDNAHRVRGLRLQELREPESVARALESPAWLAAFKGKVATDPWRVGEDLPNVPVEASASARSIVEGVRSLLVLLSVAEQERNAPRHH